MARESAYPMVPMTEALHSISYTANAMLLSRNHSHEALSTLSHISGRVLFEAIQSPVDVPDFRASVMDGYALMGECSGGEVLEVIGGSLAGDDPTKLGTVSKGKAVYVTTGGVLPDGADTVVKIESTEEVEKGKIKLLEKVKAGQWIREIGSDVGVGQVVVEKGCEIGPAEIGMIQMLRVEDVQVYKKLKVGVMSTGSELVDFKEAFKGIGHGKIVDSNRQMIISALQQTGGESLQIVDLGIMTDEPGEVEEKMAWALEQVDVLITSGGVSMGAADLVKPYLEKHGKIVFGRLMMKPGKPATFAVIDQPNAEIDQFKTKLAFALPGNPVSALVCFYLLVQPALAVLKGKTDYQLPKIQVSLCQTIRMDSERPEYHRAVAKFDSKVGGFVAYSTGNQLSSRLLSMHSANVLLEIPQGTGTLQVGDKVTALIIGPFGHDSVPAHLIPSRPSAGCSHHHHQKQELSTAEGDFQMKIGLIVCSDRASSGERADKCLSAFKSIASELSSGTKLNWKVIREIIVADEADIISNTLIDWCDSKEDTPNLIFTMGGTGFSVKLLILFFHSKQPFFFVCVCMCPDS